MTLLGRETWMEWKSLSCTKEFLQHIKSEMEENNAALGMGNFFDMGSIDSVALGAAKGSGTSQAYQGLLEHVNFLTREEDL